MGAIQQFGPLASCDGGMSKQMFAEFQRHYVELYGTRGSSGTLVDYTSFLSDKPRPSARDAVFFKVSKTAEVSGMKWPAI